MSRLDELIEKFCPNGVEWKEFSKICTYVRGVTYKKSQELQVDNKDGWKLLRANNINLDTNTLTFDGIKCIFRDVKVKKNQLLTKGDILICAGSGSKEHIGKVAFINEDYLDYTFGGFMAVIRTNSILNSRFLFHVLTGDLFKNYLNKSLKSSTINNLSSAVIDNFKIPVPPMEIQKEIVHILDSFTNLIENLTTELVARKKQYEFYRNHLLTFGDDVEKVKLKDIAEIYDGTHSTPKYVSNGIKFVSVENINRLYDTDKFISIDDYNKFKIKPQKNDVLMTRIGSIGKSSIVTRDEPLAYYVSLSLIRVKGKLLPKFLNYYIGCICFKKELNKRILHTAVPIKINLGDIGKCYVSIPSLQEQERIVSILDKFDKLCNDLSEGLPAEIEARKKQYEYYRDKLLTFKNISDNL